MKRLFFILGLCFFMISCASVTSKKETEQNKPRTESNLVLSKYSITSEIFDSLQRPLSFQLSSQCKPVSRLNWEYHMAGIGWWDIYLMSGKKLGNGIYEKTVESISNLKVIELHSTKTQYDNSVSRVEIIFLSSEKSELEKLQSDFNMVATHFTGKQAANGNDRTKNWNAGWILYTSYPIKYHQASGKWIFLVSSFDSANSPY